MKLDADGKGNVTIEANGEDGQASFVLRDGRVITYIERDGSLYREGKFIGRDPCRTREDGAK